MFALGEHARSAVVLRSDLLLQQGSGGPGTTLADDICAKFEQEYLEVKYRKQVYLTKEDAESFFHYLKPDALKAAVAAFARGLCEVLVIEHLCPAEDEGDVIPLTAAFVDDVLSGTYDKDAIIVSRSSWECLRTVEFFFPYIDSLPVERTLAVVKSDGIAKGAVNGNTLEQEVEARANAAGLLIVGRRHEQLSESAAAGLCKHLDDGAEYQGAMGSLMGEEGCIVMCLEGRGAIHRWQLICGPPSPELARDIAPTSLRAIWGQDVGANAVHASLTAVSAEEEVCAMYPADTLTLQRTVFIVKPDAMPHLADLRAEVLERGFTVLREMETELTEERAQKLYEEHKDQPFYASLTKEASSGPCVVAVLCRVDAVSVLQQLMGPANVADAKQERPRSLRARFGKDGLRNAVHGSSSVLAAAREVRFFFPEMGADPAPGDDEVKDFLFRKSAAPSSELRDLSSDDNAANDPALQQLLSQGLVSLCQEKPKGLQAVRWLARWLTENNPGRKQEAEAALAVGGLAFDPPARATRYTEEGVNVDGLAFKVEPPAPPQAKKVIDVDVSQEAPEYRSAGFASPPMVVFVCGAQGTGKTTQCLRLAEEFRLVRLSVPELCLEEEKGGTNLGARIKRHLEAGEQLPDDLVTKLLVEAMLKRQDVNRFLVDGFPNTISQALRFEEEVASVAFILHLDASPEMIIDRVKDRTPALTEDDLRASQATVAKVTEYYGPIGRVRRVSAEASLDEVYSEARRYFMCRFVYLLGAPGAPKAEVSAQIESKFGHSVISLPALLEKAAEAGTDDAAKVRLALSKGRPVDASIVCPLVEAEVVRDMALGIQNFVIVDFPQNMKQAQFLEHRLPCVAKPLLIDLSRAAAEDRALAIGVDPATAQLQTAEFFGGEARKMCQELPGLQRLPCPDGRNDAIVSAACEAARSTVMPGLTIVLGPPGSGTANLARHLASLRSNTQAVDCHLLLDRELERKTDVGLSMQAMLARGQVVPLSVTLDLLKDLANLTCSESLVVENCPIYVDQIEHIEREFRLERVFYIEETPKALAAWRDAYVEKNGGDAAYAFDERMESMKPMVSHFARLGKLERLRVTDTAPDFKKEVSEATVPQFAIVTSISDKLASQQAAALAKSCGVGPPITVEFLQKWAESRPNSVDKRRVDETPERIFSALKKYADATGYKMLVLDRYPSKQEDAAMFVDKFGDPKVVVNVTLSDAVVQDFMDKEFEAAQTEIEEAGGTRAEKEEDYPAKPRAAMEALVDEFTTRCPASVLPVEWKIDDEEDPDRALAQVEEVNTAIQAALKPRVTIIVTPAGASDFSSRVADAICTCKREAKRTADAGGGNKTGPMRPPKFTVIDARDLVKPGGHSPKIEESLARAQHAADAPDSISMNMWVSLFQEAFERSSNPFGNFLVTNFPSPSAVGPTCIGPSIRDQLNVLAEIANMTLLYVQLSDDAFQKLQNSEDSADLAAYQEFDAQDWEDRTSEIGSKSGEDKQRYVMPRMAKHYYWKCYTQGKVQFDGSRICETFVPSADVLEDVVANVADSYLASQEKAEQAAEAEAAERAAEERRRREAARQKAAPRLTSIAVFVALPLGGLWWNHGGRVFAAPPAAVAAAATAATASRDGSAAASAAATAATAAAAHRRRRRHHRPPLRRQGGGLLGRQDVRLHSLRGAAQRALSGQGHLRPQAAAAALPEGRPRVL
eukprot:TRINITY_DN480_c1_g1_i2.p1 TRINITY_DN480_c1_g1~~TRINITY_DN480_c1_g1_i2.p1  ORF type:complete len:1698 (+),score=471.60 TRINITY_DN480_c1_g1_i2:89-5182(+)